MLPRLAVCVLGLTAVAAGGYAAEPDAAGLQFFQKKIRPVLAQHCYECHSENAKEVRGGLLLDTKAGMLQGGDSGPAVVPGDVEASLLIGAVQYTEDARQMPPKGKLPDEVIADFVKWIKMDAPDPRERNATAGDGERR